MLRILTSALVSLACSTLVLADPPAKPPAPPAEPPKPAAATPPAPATSGDPIVDGLLDKLEAKGNAIHGLSCKLIYNYVTVMPVESAQPKIGDLHYSKPAGSNVNGLFKIHFTGRIDNGVIDPHDEQIAFDGNWLVERNDKAKTIIRREVVKKGEKINPFELGKGPFPMPFGQKRADMLSHFKINREKPEATDPPGAVHLHCIPLPQSNLASRYKRVEMYIDTKTDLPIKMVCERLVDDNRIEVTFTEVDTKAAPAPEKFKIEVPKGFEERLEPMTDEPAGPNDNALPPPPPAKGK